MGLDCFWELPKGVSHPVFKPALKLCGGIFSGFGRESFRGEVYCDFIQRVTGEFLHFKTIPNQVIKKISVGLQKFKYDLKEEKKIKTDLGTWPQCGTLQEFNDLKRMFKKYGDLGAKLKGWW